MFSGTIPIIAIQLNALQVEEKIVLNFVKVLDQTMLRLDDTATPAGPTTDREYWEKSQSTSQMLKLADRFLDFINSKSQSKFSLNYVKAYIGLRENNSSRGFIRFQPRKTVFRLTVQLEDKRPWIERLDDLNISTSQGNRVLRLMLKPKELQEHKAVIEELLEQAVKEFEG